MRNKDFVVRHCILVVVLLVILLVGCNNTPSHTLFLDLNGGSGTKVQISMLEGSIEKITKNPYLRDGYSFKGWANSAEGEVSYADEAVYTMGKKDATLYAVWSSNDYAITFDKNAADATGSMTKMTVAYGKTVQLERNAFSYPGCFFAGWATSPSGAVKYADEASLTMGAKDLKLYAVWTNKEYMVTFQKNSNDAVGSMSDQAIVFKATMPLATNGYSRQGYRFAGWSTTTTGDVEYADGASYTMEAAANRILYAVWEVNSYSVSFNANDDAATGTMEVQVIPYGETVSLTANAYLLANHSFDGWAETAGGAKAYDDAGAYHMGAQDATLYALWKKNTSVVSFDIQGGTGEVEPVTVEYGDAVPAPQVSPTKDGYVFSYWSTTSSFGDPYDFSTVITQNATLYARYDNLAYEADGNSYKVTGLATGITTANNLAIPDSYQGKKITVIGDSAFKDNTGITGQLTIGKNVTSIGASSFSGCSGLNGSLTIGNNVTSIGESAFSGCGALTGKLEMGSNVRQVGPSAFFGCAGFTGDLVVGDKVESIGSSAFSGCTGLSGITIPASLSVMGKAAFDGWVSTQFVNLYLMNGVIPSTWAGDWSEGCNATVRRFVAE